MHITFRDTGLYSHPEIKGTAEIASRRGLTQVDISNSRTSYQHTINIKQSRSISPSDITRLQEVVDYCRRCDTTQTSYGA